MSYDPNKFVNEHVDEATGEVIRYHLSTGPSRVIVPHAERHKWNRKPARGKVDTCLYCGVKRCTRSDWETVYRRAGSPHIEQRRPACTGKPAAAAAPPAREP